MRAQPVAWPVVSGAIPPLAGYYSPRPETGLGQRGALDHGVTTVLTPPGDAGLHPAPELGGTGKTMAAAAMAHAARQPGAADLVVWVNASSRAGIVTGYAQALADIGGDLAEGPEDAAVHLVSWLAATGRPWLVVLDDVADPADLEGLWPGGPLGQVLVTIRHPDPDLPGQQRQVREVGCFSRREALTYLNTRLTEYPDQRIGAPDVSEDLGFGPLALGLAAAEMADTGLDCRQYRERFAERRQQLAGPGAAGVTATVVAWTLAVDRANRLAPAGLAWPALVLAALLDPGGIPAAVLTGAAACDFITGGKAADLGEGRREVRGAVHNLTRTGLATVDSASAERTVRVHPAVQAAALSFLSAGDLGRAAQAAADALAGAWPEEDVPLPLAQALRDCAAHLASGGGDVLWQSGGHTVLARAGRSLTEARMHGGAIEYWRAMTGASGRILGPRHSLTLTSRDSLAAAYEAAGRADDAILLFQRALEEQEQVLGAAHPDTLASRASLAHAYRTAGRMAEAIPLYELTAAEQDRALGPAHPVTIAIRENLSDALEAAGRDADAIKVRERVLGDCERVLGPADPGTLDARAGLAAACHAAGRLKQALPHYKRTLTDREQAQGPDHPDTMAARGKLAYAYRSAGLLKDAIPQYQQTLADRERVQGPDHPDTLTARGNLASAYHSAGRLPDALPLYEQALAGCERVLGPTHRNTLTSRANLAQAYASARRMTDAVTLLQRTLSECEATLGPANPMTEAVRDSLTAIRG